MDLARSWLAGALRARAGLRCMAVIRSVPAAAVVLAAWKGAAAARQHGFVVSVQHHLGPLAVAGRR